MRAIVLGLMAAIGGGMLWLWLQPDCSGGKIVRDQADCRTHFSDAFCRTAFARTAAIAARAGTSYPTDQECRQNWPVCDERPPFGFGPRPSHWCLVQAADGAPASILPQYNNRRQ